MTTIDFEQLRGDVLGLYSAVLAASAGELAGTRTRLLREGRDRLTASQSVVVVCGEFKRGKSSLLNALVERPGLFPVDPDICTSAVVTLRWDEHDSAIVFFADAELESLRSSGEPEAIPIDRVAEFATVQGNPDNAKDVLRVDIGSPIARLKSGVVLVDTPGLGDPMPGSAALTRALVANADAVVFVASADEPLSSSELGFLQLALSECPVVLIALTKIDLLVSPADAVEQARARIAAATGADPSGLVIVPVSSRRKRDALADGDPRLMDASGFPALEAEIWGGLAATSGAAEILAALDLMDVALGEAMAPITNDLAAIDGGWTETQQVLRAEQERYRQLRAQSEGWLRALQEDAGLVAVSVQRQLDEDFERIRSEFVGALGTDEVLSDVPGIVRRTSDSMVDAAIRANNVLEAEMDRVTRTYAATTEPPITPTSDAGATSLNPGAIGIPPLIITRQPDLRFREMWLGSGGLALAGALPFATLAPIAGAAVGAVIGGFSGLFGGPRYAQAREETRRRAYAAELRDVVLPKIEDGRRRISRDVENLARDHSRALQGMLVAEVTARGDSLAQSVRLLNETYHRDERERTAREDELVAQRQTYIELRDEIGTLRSRASELADGYHDSGNGQAGSGGSGASVPERPLADPGGGARHAGGPGRESPKEPSSGRFLVGVLPERTPLDARISLLVRVTRTAPHGPSAALKDFPVSPAGTVVTITVSAPGLRSLGDLEQDLTVPFAADSEPVRFGFRADRVGLHTVEVRAFAGGTCLGELALQISVETEARVEEGRPNASPMTGLAAEPGEVTLQVSRTSSGGYSFQLLSEALYPVVLIDRLAGDPAQVVAKIAAELRMMSKGQSPYSTAAHARERLRNLGTELWADVVPEAIRRQFWTQRDRIKLFTIASDMDTVPWELVYPVDLDNEDGFLVEQFPVVRRVYGQGRARVLRLDGGAGFIVPPRSPADALAEVAAVRSILPAAIANRGVAEGLTEVLDLLADIPSVLHFAGHNAFTEDGGSVISLDGGPLRPDDLSYRRQKRAFATVSPLVFLNGCRTAGEIAGFAQMNGWAEKFMEAGAGAFIGSLWAVRSSSAKVFAEEFYRELVLRQQPLGIASLRARQAIAADSGDPTWLAYTIYGNPSASVEHHPNPLPLP